MKRSEWNNLVGSFVLFKIAEGINPGNTNGCHDEEAVKMKCLLRIVTFIFSLFLLTEAAYSLPMSDSDLWDISQGSSVIDNSPVLSTSDYPFRNWSNAENMFGGSTGYPDDAQYNTIFTDQYLEDTEHWVEWQTPTPVTLRSFNLVAAHDGDPFNINQRGFSEFKLYSGDGSGTWNLLYDYDTDPDGDLLYGGGSTYTGNNFLELATNVTPTTSQYFRAVFVQAGDNSPTQRGPRVMELDGFSTSIPVPEPGTMLLLGTGLLGLVGYAGRKMGRR